MIELPYGSWPSVITTELITQDSISFAEMQADETSLYWTELRPAEKGRYALMRRTSDGKIEEVVPEASIRTRVHEYGGGAFFVYHQVIYYSDDRDRCFYRQDPDGKRKKLYADPEVRFADGSISPDGRLLYLVCEDHRKKNQVLNTIVQMDQEGHLHTLASGHDFYSSPRVSPDGKTLAFYAWDFPNMPWDGTFLYLMNISSGAITKVAGGKEESICQIQWSPKGDLYFCSDRSGFWNLYRLHKKEIHPVYGMQAEFGLPAWVFGRPTYTFIPHQNRELVVCSYSEQGIDRIGLIDPEEQRLNPVLLPFTFAGNLCSIGGQVFCLAASPLFPPSIVRLDIKEARFETIKQSVSHLPGKEWISTPESMDYPSLNQKKGYGFYYPPKNPNYQGPQGEKPPLIVRCHGGPSSRAYGFLSLEVQYWTSRGFGFIDVNYGGSTGFGREYLKRLEGNWGVLDVKDAISAAEVAVQKGWADPRFLFIRGGSAGGFTVLSALTQGNTFAAGTSYFGVSDLEQLYQDGHKFEARYTDRLVATYPAEIEKIRERSPLTHIEKIHQPVLLFQGDEDKIVPPNQSELIYNALKARGIPVEYVLFKGEGHGFRKAETIRETLQIELKFYRSQLTGSGTDSSSTGARERTESSSRSVPRGSNKGT